MTTPHVDRSTGGDAYAQTAGRHIAPRVADALGERVVAALRATAGPLRLLDVACGSGGLALRLARDLPYASVTGVDVSPDMIAQAQAHAEKAGLEQRVTFAVMDASQLAFETASMDAMTCNLGLHLFARPAEALSEMWRVLTPGARLWASVPDRQSWREFFTIAHDVAPDADRLLRGFMTKLEQGAPLLLALQQAGFTVTDQESLRLPFTFASDREALAFFTGLVAPFATLPASLLKRLGERFPQGMTTSYVASLLCAHTDAGAPPR